MKDDLISRQAMKNMITNHWSDFSNATNYRTALACVDAVPTVTPAQPYMIHSDGRLWVTVDDIDKVNAVVVDESKSKFCKQFYLDTEPEITRCKDCKHWIPYDWMFSEIWRSRNMADYPEDEIGCDCCDMAMKANDFCSRSERREVTT